MSVREMETFDKIGSKARLIEVDSDGRRGNPPGEVDPKILSLWLPSMTMQDLA